MQQLSSTSLFDTNQISLEDFQHKHFEVTSTHFHTFRTQFILTYVHTHKEMPNNTHICCSPSFHSVLTSSSCGGKDIDGYTHTNEHIIILEISKCMVWRFDAKDLYLLHCQQLNFCAIGKNLQ